MQLHPDLEQRLHELVKFFLSENAKTNLSAFRTQESCWIGNILDSLAVLQLPSPLLSAAKDGGGVGGGGVKILDIGTGGGFPLLPLAVSLPDAHLTGMDSTQKKIDAVQRIADALGLKNVDLLCGRAETLGHHPRYREQFDIVTARAVAEVNVLLEYASPFVKPQGKIILWKSMNIDRELHDSATSQKELRCKLVTQHVYELPGDFGKRQLLIFEKTGKISGNYPRAVGVAKKKPV